MDNKERFHSASPLFSPGHPVDNRSGNSTDGSITLYCDKTSNVMNAMIRLGLEYCFGIHMKRDAISGFELIERRFHQLGDHMTSLSRLDLIANAIRHYKDCLNSVECTNLGILIYLGKHNPVECQSTYGIAVAIALFQAAADSGDEYASELLEHAKAHLEIMRSLERVHLSIIRGMNAGTA